MLYYWCIGHSVFSSRCPIHIYPSMNRKLTGPSVPVEKLFFLLKKKEYDRVMSMAIRAVDFSSRGYRIGKILA